MTPYFFRLRTFLSYWLNAVDEHSLHSPFFYDAYTKVIKPEASGRHDDLIESLRKKLLQDHRTIPVDDLGAGEGRTADRKISAIAGTSLSSALFSRIYERLTRYFQAKTIVELGTSFGINTLYLASDPEASVTTFEGSPAVADIATLTFEFASKHNIDLIPGNIDQTLPAFLQTVKKVDFAFIDANHRYTPTVRYFDGLIKKVHHRSVIIIDDIHYSPEMEKAWEAIKDHRLVYASADLYRCGIVFFDPSLNKQHVILQV